MLKKEYPKDYETMWVCTDCGTASLYHSDIEDHKRTNKHRHVVQFDLDTGMMLTQ